MTSPLIPVSWGELLDKIAILTIKTQCLRTPEARANAARELSLLRAAADIGIASNAWPVGSTELRAALLAVNRRLWRLENLIRQKEAAGDFGAEFIALARAIYRENDERGRIKHTLNRLLQSELMEEKQYAEY